MMGSLIIDEVVFGIAALRLERGELVIYGHRRGTLPAYGGGPTVVAIMGEDGSEIWSGRVPVPAWPGADDGEMDIRQPVTLLHRGPA